MKVDPAASRATTSARVVAARRERNRRRVVLAAGSVVRARLHNRRRLDVAADDWSALGCPRRLFVLAPGLGQLVHVRRVDHDELESVVALKLHPDDQLQPDFVGADITVRAA